MLEKENCTMKQFYIALSIGLVAVIGFGLFSPSVKPAFAAGPTSTSFIITAQSGSDPCQNPSVLKQSAAVSVTTAATTAIVTPVSGDYITVCKWQLNVVGTSPTVEFEYGTVTTTACDTGATALTGAVPVATTTTYTPAANDELNLRVGVVSQELCIVSGGTLSGTGMTGYVVYVQQPY
jgi:hypothetical protein